MAKKRHGRFDVRHKETLTLFLKEYFELFFPDLAKIIRFETAKFMDKELIALFGKPEKGRKDQHRITDALILVRIMLDGKTKWILIHWEQESKKKKNFAERMFHYFCGIYFRYRKVVLPIAMFTDSAIWEKRPENRFTLSLPGYSVCEFSYSLIKPKDYKADEFERKIGENPLAAAYLPLTDYPRKDRPLIKAKAMKGIAKLPPGQGQATLFSLIQESLPLTTEEEKEFRKLVTDNPMHQEVKMLQSIEEVGIEKGLEKGLEQGLEKGRIQASEEIAKNLLGLGKLTIKEIGEITGLDMRRIGQLKKNSKSY
jgi:hypothetical protein